MKNKIFTFLFLLFIVFSFDNDYCSGQWVRTTGTIPGGILSLTANGTTMFAGSFYNGVYRSTNNCATWVQTSLNALDIYALASNAGTIFAGTDTSVCMSTNNGQSWYVPNIQYGSGTCRSFAVSGTNVYAADDNGVDRSTNNGVNWISSTYHNNGWEVAANGQYVFVGDINTFVSRSTNYGQNWSQTSFSNPYYVGSIAINGTTIFVGTGGKGIYRSTNNGLNWVQTSLNNQIVNTMVASGNNIIAGADFNGVNTSGIYVSNDNGQTWGLRNEGLNMEGFAINAMIIANGNIYIGGNRSGSNSDSVWMRPLSQVIGIKNISSNVPDKFSLSQNYPNPFNPSTIIKFEIPNSENGKWKKENGLVILKVYSVSGKEVAILVNEKLNGGSYEVTFDASEYTSGVYYYRLKAGDYFETKKMMLIK